MLSRVSGLRWAAGSRVAAAAAAACVAALCLLMCGAGARAAAAADWPRGDTDADGSFMLSPDAEADFVVPADFEVRDLTRESYRIPGEPPRYLILASRVVRPGHPYRLSVDVLRSRLPIIVRAVLYRDSVRLSQLQRACTADQMELFEIAVPANSGPGEYSLLMEGNEQDQLEGSMFRNRTDLRFEARSLTMLVQMDSPVYRQLQTVRFRVVLLGTDLKSFKSSADIYLLDPHGVVMKRWMSRQSNTGLVSAEYPLGERPVAGTWTVRVTARGQTEEQPFFVQLYLPPRFEVLVETPPILRTSQLDLPVVVSANYTGGGGAVSGQLTLLAEAAPLLRRPGWHAKQVVLQTPVAFSGRHEIRVPVARLRSLLQPLDGSEVKVTAQVVDNALKVTGQGHSATRVYGDTIHLKFLGGVSQVFKPHMPFRTHLVAYMTDGSRLSAGRLFEHRLDVQPELVLRNGKRYMLSKRRAQMSPNHPGVWEVEVTLSEERDFSQLLDQVRYLCLAASLKDYFGKMARAEAVAVALHTPSNLHLHLATSTHFPKVGEFLVLHVRCNFYIENFRYVVLSKGILLDHGLVNMEVPLHTFPVAVTPEMAPVATILIYHLTWYGQVISDTLRFPVSGLSRNNFTISVGRTNHPYRPRYEVEVAVKGRQGSTVGLAAFQSDLYQVTSGTDVSSYKLLRAMQKFDGSGFGGEFMHHWTTADGRPGPTVHLASHRTAFGFNETLEGAELLVITDAGLGLVVTLLNRGHSAVTVNLVLAKAPHYRFVSLSEFGKQTSVRRSEDALVEHRTSVPLAPGQTRSVILPVQPRITGDVNITLYTEHQGVKDILFKTVHVRLPGVPMEHHTAFLSDVSSYDLGLSPQLPGVPMEHHTAFLSDVSSRSHAYTFMDRSLLDTEVLASAARWLVGAQFESGLFRERTMAADQRFNDTGDVMLTSHALLALAAVAKAAEKTDSPDDGKAGAEEEALDVPGLEAAQSSAAELLAVRLQDGLSPLQAAMAALALVGRGGRPAVDAQRLLSRKMQDDGEFSYWSWEPLPLPAYRVNEHVPYLQPRRTLTNESENVLATAVALRAYLAVGQHRTKSTVNWLQARRRDDFGWLGRMYSAARDVRRQTDIQLDVEGADGRGGLHTAAETAGSRQELEVADPSDGLKLHLTGSGQAVTQLSVQYRVPRLEEAGPFALNVDAGHHSPNGSHVTIGLCYVHSGLVPGLVSAELTKQHQLALVYSSLTDESVCARLTVVRWFAVANTSRALSATVYQLHQPEHRTSTMFDVSELSRYGLCDLCGSYHFLALQGLCHTLTGTGKRCL
ncbi:uncharacterized protein LOC119109365 [Pollicipes pollicipes]|uniref:uncharacterized protein LOC119109365 n=1 Tax=Pollicipes pollicipes TaxID=41117 RepID=UPI0018852B60|nr:uncharacterized protein LOC119109365 [Pollicipes pollicipes]